MPTQFMRHATALFVGLEAISEPSAGAKVAAAVLGTATERKGKAIAIYVHPDTAKPGVATNDDALQRL